MVVVLPVCHKDIDAALRNLAWIKELDGQVPFHCIVHHDSGFDASKVVESAKLAFNQVSENVYPPPKATRWPEPENKAWQAAAIHILFHVKQPWLWWEQDAVPLKKGWLSQLDQAYRACGKPFFGAHSTLKGASHLSGIAVYPFNVPTIEPNMMLAGKGPFDAVGAQSVMAKAVITPLIQLNNDTVEEWTWETPGDLLRLTPEAVLFHRCKNASLLNALRNKPARLTSPARSLWSRITSWVGAKPGVTVVITNFQRPTFLWEAFESCRMAGLENVVISSSGTTETVEAVHHRIRSVSPKTIIISEAGDSGSNANWLRGVEAARTEWVQILHDDDRLLPDYRTIEARLGSADFLCWDARTHGNSTAICKVFEGLTHGPHTTAELRPFVLKHRLSPSPVAGCFSRSHVLETLNECSVLGKEFQIGNLLVGNDYLLWIRAIQKYKTLNYLSTPLTSFGNHDGSATVKSVKSGDGQLLAIYDKIRQMAQAGKLLADGLVELPNVTLVGIDNWRPLHTLRAMRRASDLVKFADAALVTTPKFKPHLNGTKILDLISGDSKVERERFLISRIGEAFSTSHCLHVEGDAGIRNPSAWKQDWLQYDYIGAPWHYPRVFHGKYQVTAGCCVGNSGFALISKRFADAIAAMPPPSDEEAKVSDVYMSIGLRPRLEQTGIKFAPEKVAAEFSCECRPYFGQFGWHGKITARMNGFEL